MKFPVKFRSSILGKMDVVEGKGEECENYYVYRLYRYVTGPGARIILICISNFSHTLLLVTRVVWRTSPRKITVDPAILSTMAFAISPTTVLYG